jgi:thiamine transport system permease protein
LVVILGFAFLGWGVPLLTLFARHEGEIPWLDPEILAIAKVTLRQAGLSTVYSVLIGLPLGVWTGNLDLRSSARVQSLFRVPFSVPTVIAATAWVACLGRNGILARAGVGADWSYSFAAVILAHVFYNAPWIAAQVAQAIGRIPGTYSEAARTLGAGPVSVFRTVLWPSVAPALAAAAAQVFALCSMSFAIVLILGGGPGVSTLETSLYARIRYGTLDLPGAIACAVWEIALTVFPWVVLLMITRTSSPEPVISTRPGRPSPLWRRSVAGAAALVFIAPYLLVLSASSLSSLFHGHVLAKLALPAWVSIQIAVLSSAGAVSVACAALIAAAWAGGRSQAGARTLAILVSLPSGLSALVLGLGFWLTYSRWIDPFSGSLFAMCSIQVLLFTPLAYRTLWPLSREPGGGLLDAAATLGAHPIRAFFAVEWPRYSGPIASTLGLIAGMSLGEVAAVSLFYSERLIPLPLVISRWMSQYRFEQAQGLSGLLLLASIAVVLSSSHGGSNVRPA